MRSPAFGRWAFGVRDSACLPRRLKSFVRRGYRYDATVFPNLLNPLARAYFFATSKLSAEERERRKALFGNLEGRVAPRQAVPLAARCR